MKVNNTVHPRNFNIKIISSKLICFYFYLDLWGFLRIFWLLWKSNTDKVGPGEPYTASHTTYLYKKRFYKLSLRFSHLNVFAVVKDNRLDLYFTLLNTLFFITNYILLWQRVLGPYGGRNMSSQRCNLYLLILLQSLSPFSEFWEFIFDTLVFFFLFVFHLRLCVFIVRINCSIAAVFVCSCVSGFICGISLLIVWQFPSLESAFFRLNNIELMQIMHLSIIWKQNYVHPPSGWVGGWWGGKGGGAVVYTLFLVRILSA